MLYSTSEGITFEVKMEGNVDLTIDVIPVGNEILFMV